MFRLLSLTAALALVPLSAALAQEAPSSPAAEARIEALAEAFEARMEAFAARAEIVAGDARLSEAQKEAATAALWVEYQPDVMAFTSRISAEAGAIAQAALAEIDVDAVVQAALKDAEPEMKGALTAARNVAGNGAWALDNPEQLVTYELIADYALGQASDAIAEAYDVPPPPPAPAAPPAPAPALPQD